MKDSYEILNEAPSMTGAKQLASADKAKKQIEAKGKRVASWMARDGKLSSYNLKEILSTDDVKKYYGFINNTGAGANYIAPNSKVQRTVAKAGMSISDAINKKMPKSIQNIGNIVSGYKLLSKSLQTAKASNPRYMPVFMVLYRVSSNKDSLKNIAYTVQAPDRAAAEKFAMAVQNEAKRILREKQMTDSKKKKK